MICILHGYLLEGSGSNLWTRAIVRALCRAGETVHLMCQENHPDIYDFVSEAWKYGPDERKERMFSREVPYPGRCIIHKPILGELLPVYVRDRYEEFGRVVPMVELGTEEIERYIEMNSRVLNRICAEHEIHTVHANHVVLMSVVAQRVCVREGIPYAVMPHGSAIEYTVKKDERFHAYAEEAIAHASRVYVIGHELRGRVTGLFPGLQGLDGKMRDLNLGVDTGMFRPVGRGERPGNIRNLCDVLAGQPRGKSRESREGLKEGLSNTMTREELLRVIGEHCHYELKRPDEDAEERLRSVDWQREKILLFVGRLIAAKGVQSVAAAFAGILLERSDVRLIIVGHGPLREPLEAFFLALDAGARDLTRNIIHWGRDLEGSDGGAFSDVGAYLDALQQGGQLEEFFRAAESGGVADRVIFTGYLTHRELQYLFPCSDVAIFPSIVSEAGPLVFLEAMASGCFPMGTYKAGMKASIDAVRGDLPEDVWELMKLRPDVEHLVGDIVGKGMCAIGVSREHTLRLASVAEEAYDWTSIGRRLRDDLAGLSTS